MADFDRILNVGVKAGVAALKDEVGSQVRAANPGMFGMGEVQQEDDEYDTELRESGSGNAGQSSITGY